MIINKFNINLFNILNDAVYILDFETDDIIFQNHKSQEVFKLNNNFYSIFNNKIKKDEIIEFLNKNNTDFIKIREPFLYQNCKYDIFLKICKFKDTKVIVYLISDLTLNDEFKDIDDFNVNFEKISQKSKKYDHIIQIFNLINGTYENFNSSTNEQKLNNYLQELTLKNLTSVGIMSIKINNFKEFSNNTLYNKDEVHFKVRIILEKFFRSNDIYSIQKDEFIIICENISNLIFYQKIQKFNNFAIEQRTFSYSVGVVWNKNLDDIQNAIKVSNDLKLKSEKKYYSYKENGEESFSNISLMSSNKKQKLFSDVDTTLSFASSSYIYNKKMNDFYFKVIKKLNKNKKYVMIMLDIKNFKSINEMYGYQKGNEILELINNILIFNVENKGICVHSYSDVFYIFYESFSDEETKSLIFNINTEVSEYFKNMNISLSLFYGIYRIDDYNLPIESMCERANYAHKNAKKSNIDNFIFYYKNIKDSLIYEKGIENEMKNALKNGEFKLYLQSKYNIMTDKVVGAEALVRWHRGENDLISPDKFIPIFEKNGFVVNLDLYMLDKACDFIKKRIDQGKEVFPISVNMSKLHFNKNNFANSVLEIIQKHNIPTSLIKIEVTESLLIHNVEEVIKIINELKNIGVKISIDDFGTGYSSLSVLKDLDIDTLKIDAGFFKGFKNNKKAEIIIRHIVSLGNSLGIEVVAEGVETKEEVLYLKKINCPIVQGFYFSKPKYFENY